MNESKEQRASLKFLFIIVVKEILKCDVNFCHSLDIGMRGFFNTKKKIKEKELKIVTEKMYSYIHDGYPILKLNVSIRDAINYYNRYKQYEKSESTENLINETVVFHELLGNYNFFYLSNILDNTNKIKDFKIVDIGNNNFVLIDDVNNKKEFNLKKNVLDEFDRYNIWLNRQDIKYVTELNKIISDGKIEDFIKKNDIMVNAAMTEIALKVTRANKKIVFLGGPSSSGKSTTSRKFALFLNTIGKKTIKLSLDDYYKEWDEIKTLENGKKDLESIDAIDIKLFKQNIKDLIDGKEVVLPKYIFTRCSKTFDSDPVTIDKNTVIIVEGLHSLNEIISKNMDKRLYYKIYVSPFTPLTLDRHNYISTTDIRLIRRIVRDNRTRGCSCEKTFDSWNSVREGEEKYIFPYTDQADAILNTSYTYEIGVLKVYVEPLLYTVKIDSPYYKRARELLNSLRIYYPISSEYLASDNILREFIGKSEYNEG